MTAKTLAERISRNFSRVKLKKSSVKVPKLKLRKEGIKSKKEDNLPVSSIISILIKNAVEKIKMERKEKSLAEEDKSYTILKEGRELKVNGGYGTVSKGYENTSHNSYVDYGKLFSHLGKFKAQGAYEDKNDWVSIVNDSLSEGKRQLVDSETIGKALMHVTYATPSRNIDSSSLVPIGNMNSDEWEKFKLWMKVDPVMYRFKIGGY